MANVYMKLSNETKIMMRRSPQFSISGGWEAETTVGEAKKNGWFASQQGTMQWYATIIDSNDITNTYVTDGSAPVEVILFGNAPVAIIRSNDITLDKSIIVPGVWSPENQVKYRATLTIANDVPESIYEKMCDHARNKWFFSFPHDGTYYTIERGNTTSIDHNSEFATRILSDAQNIIETENK